jgi:flagellar protein FlaG
VRGTTAIDREKKTAEATSTQVSSAVAEINKSLQLASIGVQFEFDKEAHTMITKVVDVESGDVIRQMPSEEVVHVSKALGKLQGLLVSQKV